MQNRLEDIIDKLKRDIANVQPVDNPYVNQLADQVEETQKRIKVKDSRNQPNTINHEYMIHLL